MLQKVAVPDECAADSAFLALVDRRSDQEVDARRATRADHPLVPDDGVRHQSAVVDVNRLHAFVCANVIEMSQMCIIFFQKLVSIKNNPVIVMLWKCKPVYFLLS